MRKVEILPKEQLRKEYDHLLPKYRAMEQNLSRSLDKLIRDASIDFHVIEHRIKGFDSFYEKTLGGYKDPLKEIKDVCGLRIVCLFQSDIDKIAEIIQREFIVDEITDKSQLLGTDRFGYRSRHFIVRLKDEWLKEPTHRGLEGLSAEIQVRTMLEHSWAAIEHKIQYKSAEQVPTEYRRRFSQLSALLELADEAFDDIRKSKEEYLKNLKIKASIQTKKEPFEFDVSQPLNLDTLVLFLDHFIPDRERRVEDTGKLLDEILEAGLSMRDLLEILEKGKPLIPTIEKSIGIKFHQTGVMRMSLMAYDENYLKVQKKRNPLGLDDFEETMILWKKGIPTKGRELS